MSDTKRQTQDTQRTPSRINKKQTTHTHTQAPNFRLQNSKDNGKILTRNSEKS
jgi:hypothetical protein